MIGGGEKKSCKANRLEEKFRTAPGKCQKDDIQVFKCVDGLAPAYLLNECNFSRDFHKYKTRNKDLIRVTRAKTTKYQSSFRYNGAKAWNTLPHLVRTETSLSSFKHKLKKHLFM